MKKYPPTEQTTAALTEALGPHLRREFFRGLTLGFTLSPRILIGNYEQAVQCAIAQDDHVKLAEQATAMLSFAKLCMSPESVEQFAQTVSSGTSLSDAEYTRIIDRLIKGDESENG